MAVSLQPGTRMQHRESALANVSLLFNRGGLQGHHVVFHPNPMF